MKKFPLIIFIAFCIFSLNLKAYDGLNLTALPKKDQAFVLKRLPGDEDEGVKGKIIVTAGIGLNWLGTTMELRYLTSSYYDYSGSISGHQTMPMFNIAGDYGLLKNLSVGGAFGYQTVRINFSDIGGPSLGYHDTWTRLHFAVRGDYYIVANKNISLYTGAKLGYNIYTVQTTIPASVEPNYLQNMNVYTNPISAQAHFGFSYFVNGAVGVNAEFGLGYGGPYMLAVGATVKL